MIESTAEQGSAEWLAARLGVVTASNFAKVISKGVGRRAYMLQLAAERLSGLSQPFFRNTAMEWGTEHEQEARECYELFSDNTVIEKGLIYLDDSKQIGASPDGLIGENGGIEIKCPNSTTHIEWVLSGKLPSKHKAQVQGCMWVTGRDWWDFATYDPRVNNSLFIVRVTRDDEYVSKLSESCTAFLIELNAMTEKFNNA